MLPFLVKRIISGIVLVFAVSTIAFLLVYSSTTNVARTLLGENATAAQLADKEALLGLDRPLYAQFFDWLGAAIGGDLGTSWFTSEPVATILGARVPVTLSIVTSAVIVTALVSAVLGIAAALRGGWCDRLLQILSVLGFSLPNFWIALMLVLGFAISLHLFPATGYVPFAESPGGWAATLILPATALAVGGVAASAQQVRGAMIDVLRLDYVRTLRARGLSEASVLYRHALRNAFPPVLTVLSLQFIGLLGGAVVVEKVFAIPGLGSLTVNSALRGDAPVLLGIVVVMVVIVVIVNLVIDATAGWVNPKVRMQ